MSNTGFEAAQYILDTNIMFSVLPTPEKLALQPLFEVRRYESGDEIARQGEPMDGMYVVYSGQVRQKQQAGGKVTSLGVIEEEGTFGEMALLQAGEWPLTAVAVGKVTVLFLQGDKVRNLAAKNNVIQEHFKTHISLIEVSYRLRSLLGKAKYSQEQFFDVLRNLGVRRFAAGKPIFEQGAEDPRLYYIEVGLVELSRRPLGARSDDETVSLDKVRRGGTIGEAAALSGFHDRGGVHTYSATALSDTTVLVIRKPEVAKLLDMNPELHDRLQRRVRELDEYEQEELSIRKRNEGVDNRLSLQHVTESEFRSAQADQKTDQTVQAIQQNDESECAAACLAMVANGHGKTWTLGQVREQTGLSEANINPDRILQGAEVMGFRARAYAISYADLQGLIMPCIVGWEGYHYVVVLKASDSQVHIADPATGKRIVKKADFLKSWEQAKVVGVDYTPPDTGVVLAFYPTQKFQHEDAQVSPIRHFLNFILPHKRYFGEIMIAALVINLLGLATPLFIQTIVDVVVVQSDAALLNMMLMGMVLATVFTIGMTIAQSLLLAYTIARIDMQIMAEFFRHILSLPMSYFLSRYVGEITQRFGENQKVRAILTGQSITTVLNVLMVTVYFAMMFTYNIQLAILVVLFIPIYIGLVFYFTPKLKKINEEMFNTGALGQSYLVESLSNIETIKATANEYFARSRWENTVVDNVNQGFRRQRLMLMNSSLFQLTNLASQILILWYGANQVMANNMTIGELMGFNMLVGLVMGPVLQMVNLWTQLQEIRVSIDRVGEVLSQKPEQPAIASPSKMRATINDPQGKITFEKVNFSYTGSDNQEKLVMREFDLVIEPGQHVAFVGPSGCGKSTIAKMVLGFNMPTGGEMAIDGKLITEIDLFSLRRNIGVVLQRPVIIAASVAENIALGDPEPDMQAVREAARLAGAEEFIMNFQLGYQTAIGDKGIGLSGGQAQRICIARALYRKPKIMIFDEATSALDNDSERQIIERLKVILHNKTSISIAHRLSTIMDSDAIYYIKDGKVREAGTHHQLIDPEYLKENGYAGMYYGLAQTQFDLPPLDLGEVKAAE